VLSSLNGETFTMWNPNSMASGTSTATAHLATGSTLASLAVGCAVLIAIVIGSFVLIMWVRRRSLNTQNEVNEGFSFRDMERMVERGLISPDEFKQIKRARAMKMAKRLRDEPA
jgi:hypothetical protein